MTTHEIVQKPGIYRHLLALGVVTLSIVLFVAVLFFLPIREKSLLSSALQNSGHWVLFFAMATVLMGTLATMLRVSPAVSVVLVLLSLTLLGITTELIQRGIPGRSFDWHDLLTNFYGMSLGTISFLMFHYRAHLGRTTRLLGIVSVLLFGLMLSQHPLRIVAAELTRSPLPMLKLFSDPLALTHMSVNHGARMQLRHAPSGTIGSFTHALEVTFSSQKYSGVVLHEPTLPWTNYDYFEFAIFSNLSNDKTLALRINDVTHNQRFSDRFNYEFTLEPGWNEYRISMDDIQTMKPAGVKREMDLSNIYRIEIFNIDPITPYTASLLYLSLGNNVQ